MDLRWRRSQYNLGLILAKKRGLSNIDAQVSAANYLITKLDEFEDEVNTSRLVGLNDEEISEILDVSLEEVENVPLPLLCADERQISLYECREFWTHTFVHRSRGILPPEDVAKIFGLEPNDIMQIWGITN